MRKHIISPQLRRIGDLLKQARVNLGLTQRELGERVGMPQSHISKIEQGDVDLQLSSLTEMARALELEIQLVPRQALPAVEGVVRSLAPMTDDRTTARALAHLAALNGLGDQLQVIRPDLPELPDYRRAIEELLRQRFDPTSLSRLQRILVAARKLMGPSYISNDRRLAEGLAAVSRSLRELRNINAHPRPEARDLPAHSLDGDEDD